MDFFDDPHFNETLKHHTEVKQEHDTVTVGADTAARFQSSEAEDGRPPKRYKTLTTASFSQPGMGMWIPQLQRLLQQQHQQSPQPQRVRSKRISAAASQQKQQQQQQQQQQEDMHPGDFLPHCGPLKSKNDNKQEQEMQTWRLQHQVAHLCILLLLLDIARLTYAIVILSLHALQEQPSDRAAIYAHHKAVQSR
jgi:hypothetical protein